MNGNKGKNRNGTKINKYFGWGQELGQGLS